jgi:hypothetical protein
MSHLPLADWFVTRLSPPARDWFSQTVQMVNGQGLKGDAFSARWSGAGRRLGREALVVSEAEGARLRSAGAPFVPAGWGADEVGRAILLLAGAEATAPEELLGVVEDLFHTGEIRERQALLRVLSYLPDPSRFVALAIEAVRSNALPVIEAIACDNPFPADHLPAAAFDQMIMKALFNQLSLGRVLGLERRRGSELRRMVSDYASERRAAGRPVPEDAGLVLAD